MNAPDPNVAGIDMGALWAEERRQMIAAAAFRRYEQRGADDEGDAMEDWFEAEKEVDNALRGQ